MKQFPKKKTKTMKNKIQNLLLGLALLAGVHQTLGQAIVINSFSQNGVLVCSGLQTGTWATVQWASSLSGPWQTNWAGLTGVAVSNNGTLTVSVPMFYRVLGVAATNPPAGMALIPAGSFTMGDTFNEGSSYELPLHTVYVSAFQMDRTDVTYALWQQVYTWAIAHGYSFDNVGSGKATNQPVQTVSWYDCVKWCNARSEMDRTDVTYALWQQVYTWAIAHGYSFDNVGSGKATNQPVQTVSWYDCVKWCN